MLKNLMMLCLVLALVTLGTARGADAPEKGAKPGGGAKAAEAPGPPPALVAVVKLTQGMVAPKSRFIGTVYYDEVSEVATEISGRVEAVFFEEGQRVGKGARLVKLDAELLGRDLESTRAAYGEAQVTLEKARLDLKRNTELHKKELLSDKEYDDYRFSVLVLEKRAASLKAELERKEAERKKKTITSPFDGVVVKRSVDRGEWLAEGSTVATVAKDDVVEVLVNVPESVLPFIKERSGVTVEAGGRETEGRVYAVIRRGDVSTRTFPVKITLKNSLGLYEGMEARVELPSGARTKGFLVHRDAVLTVFGRTVVYAVAEGKAKMIPVEVLGYEGVKAGISGQGLSAGMDIVVKGNERLRPDQPVMVSPAGGGGGAKGKGPGKK